MYLIFIWIIGLSFNMNEPLISVLLCTYNDEKYIKDAIESILNQTFKKFEFIIVNDGSTDRTLDIIKQYNDERIVLIDKKNTGLTDSLNLGVSIAKTNWIARMDGDDISINNRFENQIKYLKDDVAVIGTQCEFINEFGKTIGNSKLSINQEDILKNGTNFKTMFMHPSVIVNKKMLLLAGGYDYYIYAAEDLDLWLKLSHFGRLLNLKEVLIKYRLHPNKISNQKRKEQLLNASIAIYKFKNKIFSNISVNDYQSIKQKIEFNNLFKLIVFFSQKSIGKTGLVLKFYNVLVLVLFLLLKVSLITRIQLR